MPAGFSWSELGVDSARILVIQDAPILSGRDFVLYWCMVNPRVDENPALDAAIALGNHLRLPVAVYQALRPDSPHASDRLHAFALEGPSSARTPCAPSSGSSGRSTSAVPCRPVPSRPPRRGSSPRTSPSRMHAPCGRRWAPSRSITPSPLVAGVRGGRKAALKTLKAFIETRLENYETERNDPGKDQQSGLSPYFHWGHLFAGEAARAVLKAGGKENPAVQSFLEELLVRRELAFNYCLHTPGPRQLSVDSLPRWARETLEAHREDTRKVDFHASGAHSTVPFRPVRH